MLEPPRRFSYSASSAGDGSYAGSRRVSCTDSCRILSNYHMGSSFGTDDYFVESEDEQENENYEGVTPRARTERQRYHSGGSSSVRHKRTDSTRSKPGFLEVPGMVSCEI